MRWPWKRALKHPHSRQNSAGKGALRRVIEESTPFEPLKLYANSPESLQALSAFLQNGIGLLAHAHYAQKNNHFFLELSRCRHEADPNTRILAMLEIREVLSTRYRGFSAQDNADQSPFEILSLNFTATGETKGELTLFCAESKAFMFEVEGIAVYLKDRSKPRAI